MAEMKYREWGKTGLKVSIMSFGASPFGDMYGETSDEECNLTVAMALDAGINYFDVAPSYGPFGLAEKRLGVALKGHRHEVVLTTKAGRWDRGTTDSPNYNYEYTPRRIRAEVENSLRNLQTDYIDVYQVHDFPSLRDNRYIAEVTIPAMRQLQKEGKIRFVGITCNRPEDLIEVASMAPVDTMLNFTKYSLLDQSLADELSPFARKNGIGLTNASILHMGMLTPGVRSLYNWKGKDGMLDGGSHGKFREAVLAADDYCQANGFTIADLGVKFAMEYEGVDSNLIGFGRRRSLERNLKVLDRDFDPVHFKTVVEMLSIVKKNGWI